MYFQKSRTRNLLCVLAISAGVVAPPALAQVALTTEQISAIQSALINAFEKAVDKGDEAVTAMVANSELSAISLYGTGAVSDVTSAVITSSESSGIDKCLIGRGIARGAATLARQNNMIGARAAVTSLTNQGTATERSCLKIALNELGYSQLADLSEQSPVVIGGTGGGTTGGGITNGTGFSGTNPGVNAGGCLNPSCTSL